MAKQRAKPAAAEIVEAIGYVRVSTGDQADSGLGLEVQRARIVAQAAANGWRLAGIYEDAGVSARTLDRPALQEALAELRPGRVLLALKLDRFTRSVADIGRLVAAIEAAGAEWATVTERFDTTSATGRLMLRIIVELSQWEREVIAERTTQALAQKRVRGERLGATPLGYVTRRTDAGPVVELDDAGQATVERARELAKCGTSLRGIAAALTAEGRQTARGGRWHPQTIAQLLKPRYLEEMAEMTAGRE